MSGRVRERSRNVRNVRWNARKAPAQGGQDASSARARNCPADTPRTRGSENGDVRPLAFGSVPELSGGRPGNVRKMRTLSTGIYLHEEHPYNRPYTTSDVWKNYPRSLSYQHESEAAIGHLPSLRRSSARTARMEKLDEIHPILQRQPTVAAARCAEACVSSS